MATDRPRPAYHSRWRGHLSFSANQKLSLSRSASFVYKEPEKSFTLLTLPAVDFSLQLYQPKPPTRSSRDAIQPWKYISQHEQLYGPPQTAASASRPAISPRGPPMSPRGAVGSPLSSQAFPRISASSRSQQSKWNGGEEELPPFRTASVPANSYQGRMERARELKLKPDRYTPATPHDHRQLIPLARLGLPDFRTDPEHDAGNLKVMKQTIATITNDDPERQSGSYNDSQIQMGHQILKQPGKWTSELHLPRGSYPTKDASTTRHRPLYRSAQSAFMERVVDQFQQREASLQKKGHI